MLWPRTVFKKELQGADDVGNVARDDLEAVPFLGSPFNIATMHTRRKHEGEEKDNVLRFPFQTDSLHCKTPSTMFMALLMPPVFKIRVVWDGIETVAGQNHCFRLRQPATGYYATRIAQTQPGTLDKERIIGKLLLKQVVQRIYRHKRTPYPLCLNVTNCYFAELDSSRCCSRRFCSSYENLSSRFRSFGMALKNIPFIRMVSSS